MKNVLITGATGNVGQAVIRSLQQNPHQLSVFAGVRDTGKEQKSLPFDKVQLVRFDFFDQTTWKPALQNCHRLFLLRPPQIADVEAVFKPLIKTVKTCGVEHIVFLSVQGAENNRFIPHHKIEKLVLESGIRYTILRPAYFMQNFTTTLHEDIVTKRRIYLPAGKTRFTLIDTADIGKVAATVLLCPENFSNVAFDLTNEEKLSFAQMAAILSSTTGKTIRYLSPDPVSFFLQKKKENVQTAFILVMIMLHFLPRFTKEPPTTAWVEKITGHKPATFAEFAARHKSLLTPRT